MPTSNYQIVTAFPPAARLSRLWLQRDEVERWPARQMSAPMSLRSDPLGLDFEEEGLEYIDASSALSDSLLSPEMDNPSIYALLCFAYKENMRLLGSEIRNEARSAKPIQMIKHSWLSLKCLVKALGEVIKIMRGTISRQPDIEMSRYLI